jgi:hypothetical protein
MREVNVYVSRNDDPEPVLISIGMAQARGATLWLSREEAGALGRALEEEGLTGPPGACPRCADLAGENGREAFQQAREERELRRWEAGDEPHHEPPPRPKGRCPHCSMPRGDDHRAGCPFRGIY